MHLDVSATGNAAGTHTSRNDRRVGSLTASDGENTLSVLHTLDVFGRSFESYENDFLTRFTLFGSLFGGKYHRTGSRPGRCGDTFADYVVLIRVFKVFRIESGVKEHVERLGVDLHKRILFGNHAFVDKVAGDLDSRRRGTLTVSGLQHIEFTVLDGEFHILHIAVVIFENGANFLELFIYVGENFRHLCDRHRRSYARNDVFALSVGKELTHETFFAGSGVTGKRDARAAVVAHVTESHHLYVYSGTPTVRNVVVHTVDVRSGVVPTSEYGFDSLEKLNLRVGGEVAAELFLIFGFELVGKGFKVVGVKFYVERNALLFLHLVDEFFKVLLADFHNDVREHLNESSVAVPSPSGVAGLLRQYLYDLFVKTEVKNGIHHAGHRRSGAGTYGYEKGVFEIAEFLAGDFLHLLDVFHNFRLNIGVDLSAVFIILRAGLGRDGETLRNG